MMLVVYGEADVHLRESLWVSEIVKNRKESVVGVVRFSPCGNRRGRSIRAPQQGKVKAFSVVPLAGS